MKQLNWYQIFGKSNIPDGRTVLPTDDIQIWLNCANIWDKTYTTLAEVLADTDTLSALINSENAVDYMVRSTTWAVQISVPTMTGYTTPEGEAFINSADTANQCYGWKAFDKNTSTHWYSQWNVNPTGAYLGYKFTAPVICSKMYYVCSDIASNHKPLGIKVQGSNDGVTYTDLASASWEKNNDPETVDFIHNATAYQYYRMYVSGGTTTNQQAGATELQFYSASITTDSNAMSYIGQNNYAANTLLADATWCEAICDSEYFESVLNVKVPTMTGYTTPEGVASAKSESSPYLAWKAFDGNNSTYWQCADNSLPQWIQYKFVSSVKVYLASAWWGVRYPTQLKIQGSNDGSTWVDLTDTLSGGGTNRTDKYVVTSPSDYLYYRLNVSQISTSPNVYTNAIQFYGREDV